MWAFLSHRRLTAYSEISERAIQFPDCRPLVQNRRICRAPRQHDAHTARASNQTESERKTFEAGFKSMQQGFTATLDQFADCLAKTCIFGASALLRYQMDRRVDLVQHQIDDYPRHTNIKPKW